MGSMLAYIAYMDPMGWDNNCNTIGIYYPPVSSKMTGKSHIELHGGAPRNPTELPMVNPHRKWAPESSTNRKYWYPLL